MFKQEKVWDFRVMTKGTIVKLTGFSPMNNFTFKGLEYKVKKAHLTTLTVQSKNGLIYEIEPFEIGDDSDTDLVIEIIKQEPYIMPF